MKPLLLPFFTIALLLTGCCWGKEDIVNDTDPRYKIKYKSGDILFYKADNGQTDTFLFGVEPYVNIEEYDCYSEIDKDYLYVYHIKKDGYFRDIRYIQANKEKKLGIQLDLLSTRYFANSLDTWKIIDTTVNGLHYREMYHFYTAKNHTNNKKVSAYLLYDLTYNTGIVQYRDTSGVLWTLQNQ